MSWHWLQTGLLQSGEGEEDGVDYSQVDSMYDDLLDRLDALDHQSATAGSGTGGVHSKHGKVGWNRVCMCVVLGLCEG